jgi:hypothetical protein
MEITLVLAIATVAWVGWCSWTNVTQTNAWLPGGSVLAPRGYPSTPLQFRPAHWRTLSA